MDKIKCPHCGAAYNETYDECPFCAEEEMPRRKTTKKTKPGNTRKKNNKGGGFRFNLKMGPDILTPVLGGILVLLVLLLGYFLLGGSSSGSEKEEEESNVGATQEQVEQPDESESLMPEVEVEPAPDTAVSLNRDDFTLLSGESFALEASGGSGVYTWSVENALVATVQAGGVVSAVGGGNTVLTVTDGYTTAECIVRVKGATVTGSTSSSTASSSTGSASLSTTDVSISVAESFTLKVDGGTGTFSVDNATIATVTDSGEVTGVSSGTATVSVTVGDQTLTCIVRVRS